MSLPAQSSRSKGDEGEDAAVRYLESKGMKILARNFRCPGSEIDIIVLDASSKQTRVLVCVEVKYWKHTRFPLDDIRYAVDNRKLHRMRIGFGQYVALHPGLRYDELRMDVICLAEAKVYHFEGVG